jgi:hypothetical protein
MWLRSGSRITQTLEQASDVPNAKVGGLWSFPGAYQVR